MSDLRFPVVFFLLKLSTPKRCHPLAESTTLSAINKKQQYHEQRKQSKKKFFDKFLTAKILKILREKV